MTRRDPLVPLRSSQDRRLPTMDRETSGPVLRSLEDGQALLPPAPHRRADQPVDHLRAPAHGRDRAPREPGHSAKPARMAERNERALPDELHRLHSIRLAEVHAQSVAIRSSEVRRPRPQPIGAPRGLRQVCPL